MKDAAAITPRPIRAGDVPMVLALIDRCYREYGLVLNLEDECEAHLEDPGTYFRAHGGEFWVVTDDDDVVRATAALYVHQNSTPRVGELKSMYVDAPWRRRGIGRALTLHVMREAARAGCGVMELWSDTRFEPAHRMYESLGFERIGRRALADSNNSAEWGYRKALTAEAQGRQRKT